ncbi:MAG: LysR family transcriptional regulator [Oscillospiraceae bacterium]|nr:LysR family transcriptional regulator [Oscillospiraceae bacterium]
MIFINTDFLRNFVTVVDEKNITHAAEKLHISQPSLTNQIKYLESYYGKSLLVRHTRMVTPTAAGRIIYDNAKSMISIEDAMPSKIEDLEKGFTGTLNIGISSYHADSFLRAHLSNFSKKYPSVKFNIVADNVNHITEMMKNRIIEICFVRRPTYAQSDFKIEYSYSETFYAIRHRDSGFLDGVTGQISLASLRDIPLSLPRGYSDRIIDSCINLGFKPNVMFLNTSRDIALFWAEEKLAVSCLILDDESNLPRDCLIANQIDCPELQVNRSVCTVRGRELTPVARNFLREVGMDRRFTFNDITEEKFW